MQRPAVGPCEAAAKREGVRDGAGEGRPCGALVGRLEASGERMRKAEGFAHGGLRVDLEAPAGLDGCPNVRQQQRQCFAQVLAHVGQAAALRAYGVGARGVRWLTPGAPDGAFWGTCTAQPWGQSEDRTRQAEVSGPLVGEGTQVRLLPQRKGRYFGEELQRRDAMPSQAGDVTGPLEGLFIDRGTAHPVAQVREHLQEPGMVGMVSEDRRDLAPLSAPGGWPVGPCGGVPEAARWLQVLGAPGIETSAGLMAACGTADHELVVCLC